MTLFFQCKGKQDYNLPYNNNSAQKLNPFVRNQVLNNMRENNNIKENDEQMAILDYLATTLRKSLLVTCNVEREELSSTFDISCPTHVRHVSHVKFDCFNGFLGLPHELQPQLPPRVPSASVSAFGVSPQSMHCSIDERGNSVPTLLVLMQKRLYTQGGLQAEGIFRINAENSQESSVRSQLNKGIVPLDIDVHCLAGLIKAWFRELPKGVLDVILLRLRKESSETSMTPFSFRASTSFGELIFEKQQDISTLGKHCKSQIKDNAEGTPCASVSVYSSPVTTPVTKSVYERGETEGIFDRLSLRKGANKPIKKTIEIGVL